MPAILSGTYTCTTRGLLYTYNVLWDGSAGGTIEWKARISSDGRLTTMSGAVPAASKDDECDLVRAKVHEFIEAYSRARILENPDM